MIRSSRHASPKHFVFATDAGYWNHTIVAISSLLSNLLSSHCCIYIICDDLPLHILRQVRWLSRKYPRSTIYPIAANHQNATTNYLVRDHLTSATYYRFFIDRLLPLNIEKVLYLDSDIIVNGPLDKLFDYDLQHGIVAAVPEADSHADLVRLNLPSEPGYFNAGVLLIDLQAWRRERITDQLLDICSNRPDNLTWPSQDPLNLILRDIWRPLPPIYNYNHGYSALVPARRAYQKPLIIHFSGTPKPWTAAGLSLASLPFWIAASQTPAFRWFLTNLLLSTVDWIQRKARFS